MSAEDLENYETDAELALYREYRDVVGLFSYVVETERRFYLANEVTQKVVAEGGRTRVDIDLRDAWVWDMYRQNRFVAHVRVVTFKDVNIEELPRDELELNLFGFRPFHFDLQYDSFPSGHALTIFCVAVIASAVLPALAPLWFAIALYLAMTRVFLNAHFLSDVLIGSAVGLLTARETVFCLFPALFQPWF